MQVGGAGKAAAKCKCSNKDEYVEQGVRHEPIALLIVGSVEFLLV